MSQEDALTQVIDREKLFATYDSDFKELTKLKSPNWVNEHRVLYYSYSFAPCLPFLALGLVFAPIFFMLIPFAMIGGVVFCLGKSVKGVKAYEAKKLHFEDSMQKTAKLLVETDPKLGSFYEIGEQNVYSDYGQNTSHTVSVVRVFGEEEPTIYLNVPKYVASRGKLGFGISGTFKREGTFEEVSDFERKLNQFEESLH